MIRGKRLTDSIAMSGVVFMRAGSKWIAGLLPRGIATPVNTRDDEFERVAMAHWRSLLGVEKCIEPDNPLGEDLLQETLVWAWRGFDPFKAGTNGAWLFRIMFNVPYSIHAAGQPRARRGKPQPRIKSAARGPDRHKRCDGAARAFQKNSPKTSGVLWLTVVERFTGREMAKILLIPIGPAVSRISRARQALRAKITFEESTSSHSPSGAFGAGRELGELR